MTSNNGINILSFLLRFFTEKQCTILYNDNKTIHVKLTIEMDKALMNRPFYWHYIEATGRVGEPKQLILTTEQTTSSEVEWIHHGSPRLEQIYQIMIQGNDVIQLFETQHTTTQTMLQPWLLTNYCVAFQGKLKKELFFSIGLNLINGTIVNNMMERLSDITLSPTISAYCYIITPIIKLESGYKRIEQLITQQINEINHNWADESIQHMNEEIQMANYFYDEDDKEKLSKEVNSIKQRLQPTISHNIVNGGVIYLSKEFIQPTNK